MAEPTKAKTYGVRETLAALGQPRVAAMAALGFASGLPFLLTGATFGYWLRDAGTTLTAIGFLSWVGLAYTFKVLWSPFIDRLPAPLLGGFGRRRGWALLTQLVVAGALLAMAVLGPAGPGGLATIGALAVVVAFASATQDIAVDAWRIEAARDGDELGLFTSVFQLGYRAALLVTDALILVFAQYLGWPLAYGLMAVFMGVGLFAALRMTEPQRASDATDGAATAAPLWTPRGFADATIGPFAAFFRAHGALALLMLLMISVYRLPEFLIGPVAGPFYSDLGLGKDVVGGVRGTVGLLASILGIAAGGVACVQLGYMRSLILGAVLQGIGVAAYAAVAVFGPHLAIFGAAMATDNFCYAFAGVTLITYMSSLTSLGYTATQYALLSSTYTLFGKLLKGFSGAVIDGLAQSRTLMDSYAIFYLGCGAVAIPALALCLVLAARQRRHAGRRAELGAPMLESVASDIWCRAVPLRFFGLETGTRMTLLRLSESRLLVHSPTPLTPELKAEVDALGTVAGIVAPSLFHHLYVAQWMAAYPQAIAACCPGLEQKRRDLRWQRVMRDTAEAEWRGEVDQVYFSANTLADEVVLFHRASRTLVCADVVFNLARHASPLTRVAAILLGNREPGATLLERVMIRDHARAREQIERMLAWKPERIVLAHGPIIERDATAALRRAFAWLELNTPRDA